MPTPILTALVALLLPAACRTLLTAAKASIEIGEQRALGWLAMTTRGPGAVVRGVLVALAAAAALQACGGSTDDAQIDAAVAGLHGAFVKRDASAACSWVTAAYWSAFRQQVDAELQGSGSGGLRGRECRSALGYLFAQASGSGLAARSFTVSDIAVRGDTATATLKVAGGPPGPARFVRGSDRRWRLDCCTGSQQEGLPEGHYRVPSGAMLPTLRIGQSVTTDNAAMRAHPPSIGDIIVFHPPRGADAITPVCANRNEGAGHAQACGVPTGQASNQTFIKRVVGLPNDRIAIVNGHVIRNGMRERDPYVDVGACASSTACNFPRPVLIPKGEYFVLGDNRGASDDSRFWGPVPRKWIIGAVLP